MNLIKNNKKIKAFSLVELILALIVIGVILFALVPVVMKKANKTVSVSANGGVYECSTPENCDYCVDDLCVICKPGYLLKEDADGNRTCEVCNMCLPPGVTASTGGPSESSSTTTGGEITDGVINPADGTISAYELGIIGIAINNGDISHYFSALTSGDCNGNVYRHVKDGREIVYCRGDIYLNQYKTGETFTIKNSEGKFVPPVKLVPPPLNVNATREEEKAWNDKLKEQADMIKAAIIDAKNKGFNNGIPIWQEASIR